MSNYNILHGNCLDILPTIKKESISAIVTDPPYECSTSVITRKNQKDLNSNFGSWDKFFTDWISLAVETLKPDSCMVIFVPATRFESLMNQCIKCGLKYVQPWFFYKCLGNSTRLYVKTPFGEERHGSLENLTRTYKQLNKVQVWTGSKWSNIKSCTKTYSESNYIIKLRNGEKISCSKDHRWPLQNGEIKSTIDLRVGDIFQVCQLPECNNFKSNFLPDEDIGWLIGLYLAEGSFCKKDKLKDKFVIQFALHQNEIDIQNKIKNIAAKYHGSFAKHDSKTGNGTNCVIHSHIIYSIIKTYVSDNTSKRKHLSQFAWQRNNMFLKAVFQGYLDGDGSYKSENKWILGFTNNRNLANDLRTLGGKLGYDVRLNTAISINTKTGKKHKSYQGYVYFSQNRTQKHGPMGGRPNSYMSEIVSIKLSNRRKVLWDIEIEDEPHLFALASGILTHNSNPPPAIRAGLQWAIEHMIYVTKGKHKLNIPNKGRCHNIFRYPIVSSSIRFHPTQKPVGLLKEIIQYVSNPNDTILDPFSGSASTGEAAIDLERDYIGIEQDPQFYQKSVDRLNKFSLFT